MFCVNMFSILLSVHLGVGPWLHSSYVCVGLRLLSEALFTHKGFGLGLGLE